MWAEVAHIFRRHSRAALAGQMAALAPAMLLLFAGILSIILLTGLMNGVDMGLRNAVRAGVLWLIVFLALAGDAGGLFAADVRDGTMDQDLIASGGSFVPSILGLLLAQWARVFVPLGAVFAGLWLVGLETMPPAARFAALSLPLVSLRLFASALAVSAGFRPSLGVLVFLAFSAPFLTIAVAGPLALLLGFGLLFSPFALLLAGAALSFAQNAR